MKTETHTIFIRPDGRVEFVYHDRLKFLIDQAGEKKTRRVSHVEPDENGDWVADMRPVGGPVSKPFPLRDQALAWEADYLDTHMGTHPVTSTQEEK